VGQKWIACVLTALLLAANASQAATQSESSSSGVVQPPTRVGPSASGQTTAPAPLSNKSSGRSNTCDSYLPSAFVFPHAAATTLVSYHIDLAGNLSAASLYRSSGNSDLDKAAIACAFAQHQAAIIAAGKPIEVDWIGGVFWGAGVHWFGYPSPTGEPNLCNYGSYPPLAVRLNQEGNTVVSFQIVTDGTVEHLAMTKSSGYPVLDQASLDCVAAYRYFPAKQNGQPVAIDREMNINWRLGHAPLGPVVELTVEEDGSLLLEGQRFSDADALKAKLVEIGARTPRPGLCIVAMQGRMFNFRALQAMGRSQALLTAAGVPSSQFCTVPFASMGQKGQ
jgi:TonB family protein